MCKKMAEKKCFRGSDKNSVFNFINIGHINYVFKSCKNVTVKKFDANVIPFLRVFCAQSIPFYTFFTKMVPKLGCAFL